MNYVYVVHAIHLISGTHRLIPKAFLTHEEASAKVLETKNDEHVFAWTERLEVHNG